MPDVFDYRNGSSDLGAALRALPQLAPEHSAWPQLRAQLSARRRRAASRVWLPRLAIAATMLVALVPVWLLTRHDTGPATPGNSGVAAHTPATVSAGTDDSQALAQLIAANRNAEAQWRAQGDSSGAVDGETALASAQMEDLVGLVDLQLQSSRDPKESAALWQRRLDLVRTLTRVQTQGTLAAPTLAQEGGSLQQAGYEID